MAQEIETCKKQVTNIGLQMNNAMGALNKVVIGKLDTIHRTFNTAPPQKTTTTDTQNNNPHQANKTKGKGKADPPPTAGEKTLPHRIGTTGASGNMGHSHNKWKTSTIGPKTSKQEKQRPNSTHPGKFNDNPENG